jgi:predicted AAA+ superfamily ATPase
MNDSELLEIMNYWSYWEKPLPTSIGRAVTKPANLSNAVALVIQGVRRSGKSTLLTQLIKHYDLDPKCCGFVNFEDPKLASDLNYQILDQLLRVFSELRPNQQLFFFFDEIQNVADWQKWLRTRLERPANYSFIVTGSNSSLLSGEFASALTGRHVNIELSPFDFDEFKNLRPESELIDYLTLGGFPEPLLRDDGDLLLKQYFDDIIERDIRERLGTRSAQPIRQVLQMAYESAGSEISLRRIAGAAGVSVDSVASYLEAAQAAYLLFPCQFFAYSERKRSNMNNKYYPIDPALHRVVTTRAGADYGKKLELVVFRELRNRFAEVYYWRGRGEIDFVINGSQGTVPIQVTWDRPQERHHKAIESFFESFPRANEPVYINPDNYAIEIKRLAMTTAP